MRLSARDVVPDRAECSGLGEPDEGGVICCELPSSAASECFMKLVSFALLLWTAHNRRAYPIDVPFARAPIDIIPEHLGLAANSHAVSNLLYAHFL